LWRASSEVRKKCWRCGDGMEESQDPDAGAAEEEGWVLLE
jgi:hypothetical protein